MAINKERSNHLNDQTVIYILSESFLILESRGSWATQNPIPNIENIMKTTMSGQMQSDGYGGGTAKYGVPDLAKFTIL